VVQKSEQAETSAPPDIESGPATPPAAEPTADAELTKADDGYVPFPDRFRAWWNGTPLDAAPHKTRGDAPPVKTDITPAPKAPEEEEDWPARIRDRVWGQNFALPGGSDVILEMATLGEMEDGLLTADILAGCTGPAIALNEKYTAPVTLLETDQAFCSELETQPVSGLESELLDIDKPNLGLERFDRVFCREAICHVSRRDLLVQKVGLALRPGGQFIFNDILLTDIAESKKALETWRESEPVRPIPWSFDEYKDQLVSSRFELRGTSDITDDYVAQVEAAWLQVMNGLASDPLPPEGVDALMEAGRIWQGRIAALKSGKLKMMRFHTALKTIRNLSGPS